MKQALYLSIFLFTTSLFPALPPLAQSTKELQTLLGDSHVQQVLGSAEIIQEIIRTEGGYLVITQNYLLHVDVKYSPMQARPGPIPFELKFHNPINKNTGELNSQ